MGIFSRNKPNQLDIIATELAQMRNAFTDLTNYNAALTQQVLQQQFRAQGGFLRSDVNNEIGYIQNGYQLSSAVYSIVSLIARKSAQIPMKCYEIRDENALKAYKRIDLRDSSPKNLYKAYKLRTKALAEVEPDNPIQILIDKPNRIDDTSTFYEMSAGFRLLTGNSYWYAPSLEAGADKGKIVELFTMPAPFVLLYTPNRFPSEVIGYELIMNGVQLLKTTEVIHSKYPNYYWTVDGQQHYGMSPLKAGARTLKRANDSETAAIAQIENGGPAVIVANKSVSADDFGTEQLGKAKEQFKREYAGIVNKGKVKMMAGDLSVHQLGITPVEMDLIAGEQWNFAMLCNLYHVSDTLFNNHAASTESNVKEMRKDSYTSAIIPERQAQADMFNNRIVPGYNVKGKKYFVDLDLSGIQELQPDMTSLAQWLNTSWWVSPNEKREMQDFGKSVDPNMDKIWIPSGIMTMDDASIQVDMLPEDPANNAVDETGAPKKLFVSENGLLK